MLHISVFWSLVYFAYLSNKNVQGDESSTFSDVSGVEGANQTLLSGQETVTDCTCMPFHQCKNNNTTVDEVFDACKGNVIDLIVGESQCAHYLDKCCYPSDIVSNPTPTHFLPPVCGVRHEDGVGLKIPCAADNETNYGEFPWVVAVIRRGATPLKLECAGSIIHPQVVLTGAHCVVGKEPLYIRAGEWDTQTDKEQYPTQDRDVKEVIVHEGFNPKTLYNDVALLILEAPLQQTPVVSALCLPEQGEVMDGSTCVVSGWNKDVYGLAGKYQVIPRQASLPVVPRSRCQEKLRKTRLGPRFTLHHTFICAGGQSDTCRGDGGGPLACPSKNNPRVYVQAGIVAWGLDCSTENPAVYVNVPHFKTWIDEKISLLHLT